MRSRTRTPRWRLALALAAILASPVATAAVGYQITDLGVLAGHSKSYGFDVNDSGQVAGGSATSGGYGRATLYSAGSLTDLGGTASALTRGMNNHGDVVGQIAPTAALWQHGGSTAAPRPCSARSRATRAPPPGTSTMPGRSSAHRPRPAARSALSDTRAAS
jgi:probable HAF family extracellular repeat protein